jgi:hypothetical protein
MFEVPTIKESIRRFTQRLQENFSNVKNIDKTMQVKTRVGVVDETPETTAKRMNRNIEIIRITKDSGYRHVRNTLEAIEGDAYYKLRVPSQNKPANETLEFFMGFQVGRLAVVDDLRIMEQTSMMELEKHKLKEKEEYERSQRTKSAS